jgi:hypothetical protein
MDTLHKRTTAVMAAALLLAACGGDDPAATDEPDVTEAAAVDTDATEDVPPRADGVDADGIDDGDEVDEAAAEAGIVEAYTTFLTELDGGWPDVIPADLGVAYVGSVPEPDVVQLHGQRHPAGVHVDIDHDAGTAVLTDCVKDARAYFPRDQEVTDEQLGMAPLLFIEAEATLARGEDGTWQVDTYREIAETPTEEGFPFTRCVPEPVVDMLVGYLTALYDTQGGANDPERVRPFVTDIRYEGLERQLAERREQDAQMALELDYAISPTTFRMSEPDRDLTVVEMCATVHRWVDTVGGEQRQMDVDELQLRVAVDVTEVDRPLVLVEEHVAQPSCEHVEARPFAFPAG